MPETHETTGNVTVALPAALVALFPGCQRELAVTANSVREAIDALDALWPGLRDRLCDSTPRIRRHINVYVDGERAVLTTRVTPSAEIVVLTAISGG